MKPDPVNRLAPAIPLAEQAYHEILSRLSTADEDDRLTERDLADSLSMSRTPVRQALRRLAAESLVEGTPGRGYSVRRYTIRDVHDHYDLRCLFEPEAAALCALRSPRGDGGGASESEAAGLHSAAGSASFHRALAAACGNAALAAVIGILVDHPLRRLVSRECAALSEEHGGHRQILERVGASDPTGAANMMCAHLEALRTACLETLHAQQPGGSL